jgi:hypothetical protein
MARESGAPDHDKDLLLAFLKWMSDEYDACFASPGGPGEVIELSRSGLDLVEKFLGDKRQIPAVTGI